MSTPSFETTAYTPLETLLLFQNLSVHGTHIQSFKLISNILVRNPLVKNGETYDRGRLAPDALREFYLLQLKEAELEFGNGDGQINGDRGRQGTPAAARKKKAKTPPTAPNSDKLGLIKILKSRMYEQYRSTIFRQIREDERRYAQLERDIESVSAGLWDEQLLQENATMVRSRSSSATPKRAKERTNDEPLVSSVSVEVSPRALQAARTPTPQQAISQSSTASVTPQLQPSVPLRPTSSPIKLEQLNTHLRSVPERPSRNASSPASIPQQSPSPHTRDQAQEGLRETYIISHPQTKREGIKAALGQAPSPKSQTTVPWTGQNIQPVTSSSPRQAQAHRALAAPIPSPQVPPKMEVVPPPPPSSTSSPVAPPLSRPLGVKIEAPVPPPTRTPFPPITPRPAQAVYPQSQSPLSRPSTISGPAQTQPPGHQGLSGLLQLADVADTRWQQQHTSSFSPHGTPMHPHLAYSPPGQSGSYVSAPISPHVQATQQGRRTPTPSTPGGGNFGILFPTPAPATPIPPAQQYSTQFSSHSQRQTSVQQPNFQLYSQHVSAQQNFEQTPSVPSPPVQRIAPRPPSVPATPPQQRHQISPTKPRPRPIDTSALPVGTPPPFQSPGHKAEPGSPIPPRPDEISPISTPSRSPPPESPPPESPKPLNIERPRGKKRLFQEDENSPQYKINGNKGARQQARADRGKEDKPSTKRQKSIKHDKTPAKNTPARGGSSKVEKETNGSLPAPENKVKDEVEEAMEVDSEAPASIADEGEKKPEEKPRGRGRPPRKPKPQPEEQELPTKDKRSKRKRVETNAPTPLTVGDDDDSEADVASISPTPQRRHMPKLESQNSNTAMSAPPPSPLTVPLSQQPIVVATKKFLQLSAPLLGDISSHKFANLFSNAVNERMAPGYRNLVFRPQDLKSIKAAVKSGTAAITNASTGTPTMTPTTDFAAATPPASSSTFATLPATTLNTPPKGIVNSVQLEKELFRMFANAIMYNKSTTEIAKETVMMARNVEGMVDNFRTAEEAGMKKALGAAATGSGLGSAKKGGARDRERENTVGSIAGEEEQSISGERGDDGDGEDSVMGDTDGASEKGKGKEIAKRKRLKR